LEYRGIGSRGTFLLPIPLSVLRSVSKNDLPNLKAGDPNYDYKTDSPKKFSEIKVPRDDSLQDAARLGRKSGLQRGKDGDVTIVGNLMRLRPEKRGPYAKVFLEGVIFINN